MQAKIYINSNEYNLGKVLVYVDISMDIHERASVAVVGASMPDCVIQAGNKKHFQ